MDLWKVISLFALFCLIVVSVDAAKFYRWKDDSGQWHFSDQPPKGLQLTPQQQQEVNTIKSLKTPKLKQLTHVPAVKGNGFKTQRATRCEKLKKSLRYYQKKSDDNLWDHKSRQKKRDYLWQIQQQC